MSGVRFNVVFVFLFGASCSAASPRHRQSVGKSAGQLSQCNWHGGFVVVFGILVTTCTWLATIPHYRLPLHIQKRQILFIIIHVNWRKCQIVNSKTHYLAIFSVQLITFEIYNICTLTACADICNFRLLSLHNAPSKGQKKHTRQIDLSSRFHKTSMHGIVLWFAVRIWTAARLGNKNCKFPLEKRKWPLRQGIGRAINLMCVKHIN